MHKIIDNFLEIKVFENIKSQLTSSSFPWYFLDSTSYSPEIDKNSDNLTYSLYHFVMEGGKKTESLIYNKMKPLLFSCLKEHGENVTSLKRIRINCAFNTNQKTLYSPHIDLMQKHKTGVLYIHGDGNTVLFSEKFDLTNSADSFDYYNTKLNRNVTIEKECEPLDNRLFCFDGLQYHSAYSPIISSRRIVIAFNYEVGE
jgi:hypothetical protein